MFDIEFVNKTFSEDELFILLGVEAQICLTHSALTLLEANRKVVLVTDAISSRHPGERELALKNLRDCGAYLSTSEAIIFLYLNDASHPDFKKLLPIMKKQRKADLLNENHNL
jgi:isochorismate hydrolase